MNAARSLQQQANEQPSVAVHVKVEGTSVVVDTSKDSPNAGLGPSTSHTRVAAPAAATTSRCSSAAAAASAAHDDHDARDPQEGSTSSTMPTPKAMNVPQLRAVNEQNKLQQLVWVTKSRGRSYHNRRSCGTLGNAKALEQITRGEAISRGFKQCKCCYGG